MKKILMFTRTMGLGGTENVILNICESLKNDFDFTVISSGGVNVNKLNELGIKHYSVEDISSNNLLLFIRNLNKIKKILKDENFDIIHTHHRMAAFYISILKPKALLYHTMHNTFNDKKFLTKWSLKKFIIVPCGNTVKKNLIDVYGFSEKKIHLIENGVRSTFYSEEIAEFEKIKNNGGKIFSFVGRLCEQKGIDELLKAWEFNRNTKSHLFIFGNGPLEKLVIDNSKKLLNVHYKGFTNNPLNVISESDCLILPSRWEGLPLTILESMSVKTQIICSNISSNREIIDSDKLGYTYELGNTTSLFKLIESFSNNELKDTTSNAYNRFCEKYSFEAFIKKYKELYEGKI